MGGHIQVVITPSDPMYVKMRQDMLEEHEADKEGALSAQKAMYEQQLAKLREQLETSNTSATTPPSKAKGRPPT